MDPIETPQSDPSPTKSPSSTISTQPNPKMPATFDRWFWTPDYRRGVMTLFDRLNAGLRESQELINFIRRRESFERAYAHQLRTPNPLDPEGFGFDDGASFLSVYQQLNSSQIELADAHSRLAVQIDRLVIGPFETWSQVHQERLKKSMDKVESILTRWEKQNKEVNALKQTYEIKIHEADEAEEDSRFSPAGGPINPKAFSPTTEEDRSIRNHAGDYSSSDQSVGLGKTVTERMRVDQEKALPPTPSSGTHSTPGKVKPPSEKRNSLFDTPQTTGTTLLNIAGVIKAPIQWSQLFRKAHATVFKQSVKVTLLGTYHGAHSGEDLVIFFKSNLPELGGSTDRAIELCRELSQQLSILRLIGELGNKFMPTHDAFYVWKPEAFALHELSSENGFEESLTELPDKRRLKSNSIIESPSRAVNSPRSATSLNISSPSAFESMNKQASETGTVLSKYLQTAVTQAAKGINELSATVGVSSLPTPIESPGETRADRLRREAQAAEKAYSTCVIRLDHTRLVLEQTISEHFRFLQRCELDRLRAAKAVIMGFNAALATLNPKMAKLAADAVVLNESFSPEGDVAALIERYRTGPFRPSPVLFHSYRNQEAKVNFGIDLSKWHNAQQVDDSDDFHDVPLILTRLLSHLEKSYPKLASDEERRKTWIYEVPLKAVHELRSALNDPYNPLISDAQLAALDPPLLASTIKIWLLELDPPPIHYSRYEDVKAIYPQRAGIEAPTIDARIDVLAALLSRLPKPHLMVIDAVVAHLRNLFKSTNKSTEDDEIYLTKLGLSLARTLVRPKTENAVTLSDRFQSLFLTDLMKYYERILPVAIGLKNKMLENEIGTKKPQRKSTRPVDMRVRRSDLGIEGSIPDDKAQEILVNQQKIISHANPPVKQSDSALPVEDVARFTLKHEDSLAAKAHDLSIEAQPNVETVEQDSSTKEPELLVQPIKSEKLNVKVQEISNLNASPERDTSTHADLTTIQSQDQASSSPTPNKPNEKEKASIREESDDEARDAPFVPPSFQNSDDSDPVDLPFIPPVKTMAMNYHENSQSPSSPSELYDEDVPLASKAHLSRISSKEKPPSGIGLSRRKGAINSSGGSPKLRGNPNNSAVAATGAVSDTSSFSHHKKASPSVGSLRSQFEPSSVRESSSGNTSPNLTNTAINRYRRTQPSGKV